MLYFFPTVERDAPSFNSITAAYRSSILDFDCDINLCYYVQLLGCSSFWSHHPRYPLPEVRVAAPCVDGDFRVEVCSASANSSTQTSASLCPYQHYAHLHCPIHFRLPTFSRTMHHASSQKGMRSGWQSGASEPHLLTRRCSNRRKLCDPSAPIAYATSGIFCKEAGAMVAAGQVVDYANVI